MLCGTNNAEVDTTQQRLISYITVQKIFRKVRHNNHYKESAYFKYVYFTKKRLILRP